MDGAWLPERGPAGRTVGVRPGAWLLAVSALGAAAASDPLLSAAGVGHLARHMTIHLLLMGLVAPLLAHLLSDRLALPRRGGLLLATSLQLALLWAWHVPALLEGAMAAPVLHVAMQASLLGAATWFWLAVFARRGPGRWRAILALLLTGKLFCLLGVLLVFAPRALYAFGHAALGHAAASPAEALADQQLAGLLMLVACPLTYVVAGIVVSARWLGELDATPAFRPPGPTG